MRLIPIIIAMASLLSPLYGHVTLEYPKGAETFHVNELVNIEWRVEVDHGPAHWDLYFSPDGGDSWDTLMMGIEQIVMTYPWSPEKVTQSGMIRIVQHNDNGELYDFVSMPFEVQGEISTSTEDATIVAASLRLSPNPCVGQVEIQFLLRRYHQVSVEVYDLLGSKKNVAVASRLPPGQHTYTWEVSSTQPGIHFVRLSAGDDMIIQRLIVRE